MMVSLDMVYSPFDCVFTFTQPKNACLQASGESLPWGIAVGRRLEAAGQIRDRANAKQVKDRAAMRAHRQRADRQFPGDGLAAEALCDKGGDLAPPRAQGGPGKRECRFCGWAGLALAMA